MKTSGRRVYMSIQKFEIIDSKEVISSIEAERVYKNSNYLMVNIDFRDDGVHGRVYAVSRDPSTLDDLVEAEERLNDQGIETLIGGEYTNRVFDTIELVSMKRINNE